MRITVHYTLDNQAFFRGVQKFYGIFNGEDMTADRPVQLINHRTQSCGFTRSGGSCYQYQTPGYIDDIPENLWRCKIFQRPYFGRNGPVSCSYTAVMVKTVNTEPCKTGYGIREIYFKIGFKVAPLVVAHAAVDQFG